MTKRFNVVYTVNGVQGEMIITMTGNIEALDGEDIKYSIRIEIIKCLGLKRDDILILIKVTELK